jgi:signal transduction histidine kinase/DNA-binding response OmpR family regulator
LQIFYANNQLYSYNTDPNRAGFLKPYSLLDSTVLTNTSQIGNFMLTNTRPYGGMYIDSINKVTYYIDYQKRLMAYTHASQTTTDVLATIGGRTDILTDYRTGGRSILRYFSVAPDKTFQSLLLHHHVHGLVQIKVQQKKFLAVGVGRSYRTLLANGKGKIFANEATELERKLYLLKTKDKNLETVKLNLAPKTFTIHKGEMWLGLRTRELHVLDNNNVPKRKIKTDEVVAFLKSINDSTLWFVYNKTVYALNTGRFKTNKILETDRDVLWVHKALNGDQWVATVNGLYHVPTKQCYLQNAANGDPLEIQHIHEDRNGVFWLSTMQGLIKWQPFSDDFLVFDSNVGMRSAELHAAYPDTLGRLWLSSNDGIMAFDTATRAVLNFTVADGLACNEQNYLAHCQTPDGMLYFGGVNGITAFNPNAITKPSLQVWHDLHINSILQYAAAGDEVAAQQFGIGDTGMLALNRQGMLATVEFTFPYYGAVKPNLEWRIQGLYPNWAPLDLTQPLLIYGIPHGSTTLEVRAEDPTYAGVYKTWKFPIYKPFYWYQLFWVRVLFVIAGVLVLIFGIRGWLAQQRAKERKLEKVVQERTETIMAQNQTLEQIDMAKTQLFNNISHEFRTPLSLIKAMSGQIKKQVHQPQELITSAQQIDVQVTQLTAMLNDVMDLSKMQVGALQVKPVAVEWSMLLKRIFAGFDGLARKKQIDYSLQMSPSGPHYLMIDTKSVERIITNFLSNAFKFTPDVGRISVQSTFLNNTLTVRVQDSGPGVSVDEAKTIFQRYVQGSAAKNAPQPGYGIGLALCKEYTDLLGGKLWVESNTGSGAAFYLEIPVSEAEEAPVKGKKQQTKEAAPPVVAQQPNEDQPRILVVEDNPDFAQYLQKLLAAEYEVVAVENGQEAWQHIQSDARIALVLTDVMMPLLDGFTLLQKIRSHPQFGYLPVVFLTALTADDERLKALRLGVDAYLSKPFAEEELLTRLAHLVLRQQDRKQHLQNLIYHAAEDDETLTENGKGENALTYDEVWMNELARVVHENFQDPDFKVPDMAFLLHVSERTLFNKLKQYTGQTPSLYLRKVRLDQAYHYLKTRRYQTIKEVAYAAGFSSPRNFTMLFKEEFGITAAQAKWKLPR